MASEDSNGDFAQAYKELNEAEQHASKLEKMLDSIESKMDTLVGSKEFEDLVGSDELKQLQDYMKNPDNSQSNKK